MFFFSKNAFGFVRCVLFFFSSVKRSSSPDASLLPGSINRLSIDEVSGSLISEFSLKRLCCLPAQNILPMGAVRITSLNPKFNGSHFGLPPSSIHRMTGWVAISRVLWRMRTAPITLCNPRHAFADSKLIGKIKQRMCWTVGAWYLI